MDYKTILLKRNIGMVLKFEKPKHPASKKNCLLSLFININSDQIFRSNIFSLYFFISDSATMRRMIRSVEELEEEVKEARNEWLQQLVRLFKF